MKNKKSFSDVVAPLGEMLNRLDHPLMFLGFVYLGLYSVEVLVEPPSDVSAALEVSSWVIYGIFILDLLARIVLRLPRLAEFSGWLELIKDNWLAILAALVPAFRTLRVLRVLVVLRGIYPYMQSRAQRVGVMVGVALPLILYTASLSVLEAERGDPNALIQSFGDALWWSMVTVTTVGYGDAFPVTSEGRFVGTFLIFTGIGLFSTVTALLASWVLSEKSSQKGD